MINKVQNYQIESLLDEEIQKFANDSNYFFSNCKNITYTDYNKNDDSNFNSSYRILKVFNYPINRYKTNITRKKSFNKSNKILENSKTSLYYLKKSNNNKSHKYLLSNNRKIKSKFNIINLDLPKKNNGRRKNSIGKPNKSKQNKSCSYLKKSNCKKINLRKNSVNKINKSANKTMSINKNLIKKHNYTTKGLLSDSRWKINITKVKKELDDIKSKIKNCKRSNKQIGNRLEKIGKFERNNKIEDKKINEMKEIYKKEKIKYKLSENIRKKQKDLINNLAKEIENMKCCCNHLH